VSEVNLLELEEINDGFRISFNPVKGFGEN
jgi:hypothetical protein